MSDPSNTAKASTDAGAGQAATDQGKVGADAQLSLLSGAGAAASTADAASTDGTESKPDADKPEGEKADDKPKGPPEKYELKLPEGMQLDEAALGEATPVFKELGLSNEQAQKLGDLYAKQMAKIAETQRTMWGERLEGWKQATFTDKEFGGDGLMGKDGKPGPNLNRIVAAIDKVGGGEAKAFREMLDQTGAGNHPEMARFLYRVGKMVGEGSVVRGDAAAKADRMPWEKLYATEGK